MTFRNQTAGRVLILVVLGMTALVSCQTLSARTPAAIQPSPNVIVITEVMPPGPTPTTGVCTSLPAGASWDIVQTGLNHVRITANGMVPGESLSFRFIAPPVPGYAAEMTADPIDKVDSSGHFVLDTGNLNPLPGTITNTWTIEMIHSRGMACTELTLQ